MEERRITPWLSVQRAPYGNRQRIVSITIGSQRDEPTPPPPLTLRRRLILQIREALGWSLMIAGLWRSGALRDLPFDIMFGAFFIPLVYWRVKEWWTLAHRLQPSSTQP